MSSKMLRLYSDILRLTKLYMVDGSTRKFMSLFFGQHYFLSKDHIIPFPVSRKDFSCPPHHSAPEFFPKYVSGHFTALLVTLQGFLAALRIEV